MKTRWHPSLVIGLIGTGIFLALALISLIWTPYPIDQIDLARKFAGPGAEARGGLRQSDLPIALLAPRRTGPDLALHGGTRPALRPAIGGIRRCRRATGGTRRLAGCRLRPRRNLTRGLTPGLTGPEHVSLIWDRLRCAPGVAIREARREGRCGASAERRNDAGGRRDATRRAAVFCAACASPGLLVAPLRAAPGSCPRRKMPAAQTFHIREICSTVSPRTMRAMPEIRGSR